MKFRKKPVVIEAFCWTGGEDQIEDPVWIVKALNSGTVWFNRDPLQMIIATLEGNHAANPGDFIIQGVQGEIYPCKPDIFEATYEAV